MSAKLNANPTVIVAQKTTTCPVCTEPIKPGTTAANPGLGSDFWCHYICVGRLYVNVRPIPGTHKVLVDDFMTPMNSPTEPPDSGITSGPVSTRPVLVDANGDHYEMPDGLAERHTWFRQMINRFMYDDQTQPSATGTFERHCVSITNTKDGARQQHIDAFHGKPTMRKRSASRPQDDLFRDMK